MHNLHIYTNTKNIYTFAFRQTRLFLNNLFARVAHTFNCMKQFFDV